MQSVEKTYIDLYDENAESILKMAPDLLNRVRVAAREEFERQGFPNTTSENYTRTDVRAAFDFDYGVNLQNIHFPIQDVKGFACGLENMPHTQITILNERFEPSLSTGLTLLPQGVFIGSIADFLQQNPDKEELLSKIYGRYAEVDIDALVSLNTMFVRDALLFYVPQGVKIPDPVRVIQLIRADVPMLLFRRIMIVVEEGASLDLLICNHTLDEHRFLTNQVMEIDVARGATLKLYDLEESSRQTYSMTTTVVRQREESNVLINALTLNNGVTRNNYWTRFLGTKAKLTLGGLAIGTDRQHIDNFTHIGHIKPECETEELFKYVMNDDAVGAFAGRIYVAANAQKTNAQQSNRNLLLSPTARVFSKPQLEIYADDVKCSHGMTTGQLSEDALFYLRQRGISEQEARTMLSIAFTDDVVKLIELPALRESIVDVITSRFNGVEPRHCNKYGKVCF